MKIVKKFKPKTVIFTAVKNRCMLHGRVFVMMMSRVDVYIIMSRVARNPVFGCPTSDYGICERKTNVLIICAITAQLICDYVFAYAKKQVFS